MSESTREPESLHDTEDERERTERLAGLGNDVAVNRRSPEQPDRVTPSNNPDAERGKPGVYGDAEGVDADVAAHRDLDAESRQP